MKVPGLSGILEPRSQVRTKKHPLALAAVTGELCWRGFSAVERSRGVAKSDLTFKKIVREIG